MWNFAAHPKKAGTEAVDDPTEEGGQGTPEEILQDAYQSIRDDLAAEIMEHIKSNSPRVF